MISLIRNNKLILIGIHVLLGTLLAFSSLSGIYGIAVIGGGVLWIILSSNREEQGLLMAGYISGAEVLLRMTKGAILYETGKYAVFIFLLVASIVGRNTTKPNLTFLFYILLLALGITFTQVPDGESIRRAVVFNLSGPILLGFCALFLYQKKVDKDTLLDVLFMMLLPIISIASYLYFRTPDIEEIVFGGTANFETSGGFGPNQVATILGLGIFVVVTFIISKKKLTGYLFLDGIILIYLIYRGLLTFSRGGILVSVIAIVFYFVYHGLSKRKNVSYYLQYLALSAFFVVGVWLYTSDITKGMLDNRYTGRNASGVKKEDATSGRIDILNEQLASFYESPIVGIGVGNGKFKRQLGNKKVTAASHNEVGRLIEEHGLIGLASLIVLFSSPFGIFLRQTNYQRAFLVAFFLFWILTIGHSAMRIAFPSFIYGLCLINIVDEP